MKSTQRLFEHFKDSDDSDDSDGGGDINANILNEYKLELVAFTHGEVKISLCRDEEKKKINNLLTWWGGMIQNILFLQR